LNLVNYAPDGSVNSSFEYTYNVLGLETGQTTLQGQWAYTYDADGELTRAVFASNEPSAIPNQNLQYSYDGDGNRMETAIDGVTTMYTTNNMDQYTQVGSTTYQYDGDGNMISASSNGVTTTYTYDELNQLTEITGPGLTANYSYDSLGNLVSQTVDGAATSYEADPTGLGNVVAAFGNDGAVIAHFTYGLGLTSQVSANGTSAFYDFDNIGSTVGITGTSGSYINQYSYLPFGQAMTISATLTNPFQFVGQSGAMEGTTGVDTMGARSYVPSIGRFSSVDPLNTGGGQLDLYAYVDNNPLQFIDPTGLEEADPPEGTYVRPRFSGNRNSIDNAQLMQHSADLVEWIQKQNEEDEGQYLRGIPPEDVPPEPPYIPTPQWGDPFEVSPDVVGPLPSPFHYPPPPAVPDPPPPAVPASPGFPDLVPWLPVDQ
jgi:RHS repeat-associated protein